MQAITYSGLVWKKRYVAAMLFFIAFIYLVLQVLSMIGNGSSIPGNHDDVIELNRTDFFSDIRSWTTIAVSFVAAILILRRKKWGWILGLSVLLVFLTISTAGFKTLISLRMMDLSTFLVIAGTFMLFAAVIILFQPSTRKDFSVGRAHYIYSAIFTAILFVLYFVLQ